MNRLNRRRFLALSSAGAASAVLVACGNPKPSAEQVNPTQIPDVAGAPPTLAPITSTPNSSASGGETSGGGEQASGGGANEVNLLAEDIKFDKTEFSIAPGGKITLENKGQLEHDFAVDDWGGVLIGPLQAGESGETTVPDDANPGDTFTYYCSIPGHEAAGMKGTLTIAEAGAGGGEEGATAEASGGGAETVDLKAEDIKFDKTEFSIAPGGTINLSNEGQLEHDFAVDDWGGVVIGPLSSGESGSFTVPDDATPGDTFDYYCSIPGHEAAGMKGTLTIAEAGSGGGGEETTPEETEEATAAAASEGGEAGASSVDLEAFDIGFKPTEFTVAPGGTINLNNTGVLEHDFAVDDWGGVKIGPLSGGESGSFTLTDDIAPGEYDFYCSIPGHEAAGMKGTVTVSAGGGGAASDQGTSEATATGEATAAASPAATPAAAQGGGEGATEVKLEAFDLGFDPKEFTVAAGGKITLENTGVLEHDLAVDDWGGIVIDKLQGGESGDYTVPADAKSGETFDFYCSIPGHKEAGMVGKLTIA
ncbi:MAG TPA: plastocyanin/azurin family copper-binding protein [Thermomicrobiales bacterium]|nr:plastocyanin/azurin family copper-binding protein [Thermomicrobiales bacterium]